MAALILLSLVGFIGTVVLALCGIVIVTMTKAAFLAWGLLMWVLACIGIILSFVSPERNIME